MSHIISDIHRAGLGGYIFLPTFSRDKVPLFSAATLATEFMNIFTTDLPFTEESMSSLSASMNPIRTAISVRSTYMSAVLGREQNIIDATLDIRYFIIPILLMDHATDERKIVALYVPPTANQRMVMLSWEDIKYCKDNVMVIEGWLDFAELKEFDKRWTMHLLDPAHHEITIEEANFKITLTSNEILHPLEMPEEAMHITIVPKNAKPDLLRITSIDGAQSLNIDLKQDSIKQRKIRNIEFALNVTPDVAETMYANPGVHEYLQDGFTDKTIH